MILSNFCSLLLSYILAPTFVFFHHRCYQC